MLQTMTLPGKVLLFAAVAAICSERVLASCDSGWTQFRDKCYIKKETKGTFLENDKWCYSMGATMVSIHSLAQNEFLRTFIPANDWTWLGGCQSQPGQKGNMWLDGSQWNFANFAVNPSSASSSCCFMRAKGEWNWSSPSDQHYQMCQKLVEELETSVSENKFREMRAQVKEVQTANDKLRQDMVSINKSLKQQTIDFLETRREVGATGQAINERLIKQSNDFLATARELVESLHQLNATADANRESIESLNTTFLGVNEKVAIQLRAEMNMSLLETRSEWAESVDVLNATAEANRKLIQEKIQTAVHNLRQALNEKLIKQSNDFHATARELRATAQENRELIESLNITFLGVNDKAVSQCPIGWQQFCDFCYISNETVGTFDQNNGWCQSLNGSMLSIHSLNENEFVRRFISGKTWMSGKQTGLDSNEFKWLDSSDTRFGNFSSLSDCLPGCGLVLDTNGGWTFAYVHSSRHVNHMVCQKQINEKEKDNELKQNMQLLEKLVFEFLGKSGKQIEHQTRG